MSDKDSNSEEEYINLEDVIQEQLDGVEVKNIYQIQLNLEKLVIKHISQHYVSPDIIIQEDFGSENQYSLYSCVYTEEELEKNNNTMFYPLVKLIENYKKDDTNSKIIIYSIAVKFNYTFSLKSDLNKDINDFKLFLVANEQNKENVYTKEIEKNINSSNIIEKLLEYVI